MAPESRGPGERAFCRLDEIPFGMLDLCRRGISVPRDISAIGVGDLVESLGA